MESEYIFVKNKKKNRKANNFFFDKLYIWVGSHLQEV